PGPCPQPFRSAGVAPSPPGGPPICLIQTWQLLLWERPRPRSNPALPTGFAPSGTPTGRRCPQSSRGPANLLDPDPAVAPVGAAQAAIESRPANRVRALRRSRRQASSPSPLRSANLLDPDPAVAPVGAAQAAIESRPANRVR